MVAAATRTTTIMNDVGPHQRQCHSVVRWVSGIVLLAYVYVETYSPGECVRRDGDENDDDDDDEA